MLLKTLLNCHKRASLKSCESIKMSMDKSSSIWCSYDSNLTEEECKICYERLQLSNGCLRFKTHKSTSSPVTKPAQGETASCNSSHNATVNTTTDTRSILSEDCQIDVKACDSDSQTIPDYDLNTTNHIANHISLIEDSDNMFPGLLDHEIAQSESIVNCSSIVGPHSNTANVSIQTSPNTGNLAPIGW